MAGNRGSLLKPYVRLGLFLAAMGCFAVWGTASARGVDAVRTRKQEAGPDRNQTVSAWSAYIGQTASAMTDCNSNGIPDDQDIENCADLPSCDDCNLNALPDECDIASGLSADVDLNGVPDECVFYDDGGVDENWGTPENWDDDEVPTNLDLIDDESVTVGNANTVNLDLHVEVDTMRVLDGASFTIDGLVDEEFEVEEQGGVQLRSDLGGQSRITIGNTRRLSVPLGTIEIESGGVLEGMPVPVQTARSATGQQSPSARIEAGNVRISSLCGEPTPGAMTLDATMKAEVFGDVVVDASQDCVVCGLCNSGGQGGTVVAGGETPPILHIKGNASLDIGGNLVLLGGVSFEHTSTVPIVISGSFLNGSTCPECFRLDGTIIFSPPPPPPQGIDGAAALRTFELASVDRGPVAEGFASNFAIGTLEVSQGSTVEFRDDVPNHGGPGNDVAYIDTLILRSGAAVTIVDRPVYYKTLINQGASIVLVGSASLTAVAGVPAIPAMSTWGGIILILTLLAAGSVLLTGRRTDTIAPS